MSGRTTHSDLAAILLAHVKGLSRVPEIYMVSDASTRRCLEDAARILVEQDERIGKQIVALRMCRSALPVQEREAVNECLAAKS